ncbi:5'-3' exoribonuclease 1 [Culicoides brevitarsis]|uniref:5'-3' exoribonuclease 1 n=1 Tax=Culicoides brevitarsis TaxID=469753 RepID=UPI00307C9E3E
MGVPKFFRYISERYPCLSELVRANQIPEFDNLYLDMNGIIHVCSHPNDNDVHFRISEEKIFKDIFQYLEVLFLMIKPRKLFFMAIDGVAPRAKMNQQRGRRFRSAKDAELLEEKAKKKGEVISNEARFDSNCITPGTEFMGRLNEALKYFIKHKISTSPIWQSCTVIYSGHETPGEGEHKIMDYIRYLKSQDDYNLDTRHCLYGLDADLIMLGLCTHEKHFSLLREEVKFGKQISRAASVHETRFFLLHLSLMRDYLELEFEPVRSKLKFNFDIECIIDDWILMGFLVGNDFIPHLPNMHINTGALPLLYNVYMEVLPRLDGYLNDKGKLHLERFEIFMVELGKNDKKLFMEHYTDLKYMNAKMNAETFGLEDGNMENAMNADVSELAKMTEEMLFDSDDSSVESEELFDMEFEKHKAAYYIQKMHYPEMNEKVRAEQTEYYIQALQWILFYYYRGVPSWSWFYQFHYSPFISDIHSFKHLDIKFTLNKPFLPFEQLLSVLPAASKGLLPNAYHELMTDKESKIVQYYPKDFETDLNGKKQEWEAVVLIPFIDEKLLLEEMKTKEKFLHENEVNRNIHGPMYEYKYNATVQGSCDGFLNFPTIISVYCTEKAIRREEIAITDDKLPLIYSRISTNVWYYKGFPTMKYMTYTGAISKNRVKVFDQPSRNDSMIISLKNSSTKDTETLAKMYIGETIFVGWPHLIEAKVTKVSDSCNVYTRNANGSLTSVNNERWKTDVRAIQEHHINRLGIDVGDIKTILHVVPFVGVKYNYDGNRYVLQKTYSAYEATYPAQAIVDDLKVIDKEHLPYLELNDVYKPGSPVFMITHPYYGCFGEVIETQIVHKIKRVKLTLTIADEPMLEEAKDVHYKIQSAYVNSYVAASKIGISENVLQKITDTVLFVEGEKREVLQEGTNKMNIGLQLKSRKNNEVVVGYVKKHHKQLLFSEKAIDLVTKYFQKIPKLFQLLETGRSLVFESELFKSSMSENSVQQLIEWIKQQDHQKCEKRSSGIDTVEKDALPMILDAVKRIKNRPMKRLTLQVKPTNLYAAALNQADKPVDDSVRFRLFDRVAVVSTNEIAPVGSKGTIVGVHCLLDVNPVKQENINKVDLYYDVLFDKPFAGGSTNDVILEPKLARIYKNHLISLNYGRDMEMKKNNERSNYELMDNAWNNKLSSKNQNCVEKGKEEKISLDNIKTLNTNIKDVENKNILKEKEETNSILEQLFASSKRNERNMSSVNMHSNTKPEEDKSVVLKQLLGIIRDPAKEDKKEEPKLPLPPPTWNHPKPKQTDEKMMLAKILTCDDLETSLSKKEHLPPSLEKPSFIPLQAITGRKNPSFKVSHRPVEKRNNEQKTGTNTEQKPNETSVKNPPEHIRQPRMQRQSRIAAKFQNKN